MSGCMEAKPTPFGSAAPAGGSLSVSGRASFGQASISAMSMRWSALHDAASAIAALAGIEAPGMTAQQRNFPASIRDAGGWRREQAEYGIEDLSAVMEPGLSALLAVHARGSDARAAANALWDEFVRARDAVLALLPPPGANGPLRRAG